MSVTLLPPQAAALVDLLNTEGAVALEVADASEWSLRVAVFFATPDRSPEEPPASARWYSVSCAGSVREIAPDPEAVAA